MKTGMLHIGAQMLMGHKKIAMESLDLHRKLSYFNPRFFLVVFDFMKVAPLRYFVEYQYAKTLICIQPIYTHTHALGRGELLSIKTEINDKKTSIIQKQ